MTGECRQLIRSDLGVGGGLGQEVGAGIGQQGRWRLAPRSPTQFLADQAPIRSRKVIRGSREPLS